MKDSEKGEDKKEKKEEKKSETEESGSGMTWLLIGVLIVLVAFVAYNYRDNLLSPSGASVTDVDSETIKIGFMGPLTGDAASYGQSIRKGVDLAFEEANLDNVEIIYEDSECDGKKAVTAINKLINVDGVQAIVGEVCSGATLAAAPIAESKGVVLISASSTSPKLSDSGDYVFRVVPSDALQGAFAANLLYQRGHRKIAVLYGNEEYGVGFKDVLERTFPGEVVASEAFERSSTDLRAQVTKIKAARPDAIFIISNSPDSSVAAIKQIKELGVGTAKLYGSEGLKGPEVAELRQAENIIVTSVTSGTFEFDLKYRDEYDESPGPFAAQGYDAFASLARSLKRGSDTGEEIKNDLYSVTFDGASGRISFDLNGDIAGNYEVFQLKKGEWTQLQ